jgi:Skp family chaperone for outer membrane proteins
VEANAYSEALRYLANAKETLQKAGKEDGQYKDVKYVKTATGTAYSGILVALDEYLKQKERNKYKKPTSIQDYQSRITKVDKKLLAKLNTAHDLLHLLGYYTGTKSFKLVSDGFEVAKEIIEYIKPTPPTEPKEEKKPG